MGSQTPVYFFFFFLNRRRHCRKRNDYALFSERILFRLTFLCVAERASPLVLWVFATASSSVRPRSPPGAGRARSVYRWWSGCTDSWRAQSGRSRRTKPRDWCSSGRWDAGPSDSLWSERRVRVWRGDEQSRKWGGTAKQERRFDYRPFFCLQTRGSIQKALSSAFSPRVKAHQVRLIQSISRRYPSRDDHLKRINCIEDLLCSLSLSRLPACKSKSSEMLHSCVTNSLSAKLGRC